MIYFNVLGHHFLILGSFERTIDLFDKRSSNYSDRPRLPMMVELYVSDSLHPKPSEKKACFRMGWDFNLGLLPYGELWRRHRRVVAKTGDYFTIFFTLTRCPNTSLFKEERSMLFYVDCLTHPTIFSTTFDSK